MYEVSEAAVEEALDLEDQLAQRSPAAAVLPHRSNVFLLSYRGRLPSDARDYLKLIAERRGRAESDLWQEVVVTADEFNQARLEST